MPFFFNYIFLVFRKMMFRLYERFLKKVFDKQKKKQPFCDRGK